MEGASETDELLVKVSSKLLLYIVLAPDCPISLKYINTIRKLEENYNEQVTFVGLFPKIYSVAERDNFKAEYNIEFDILIDHSNKLINEYNINVTPEVLLLGSDSKVLYQGAIDNWFYELGKSRSKPTEYYLKDAIDSILDNLKVEISKTEAIGCIISK